MRRSNLRSTLDVLSCLLTDFQVDSRQGLKTGRQGVKQEFLILGVANHSGINHGSLLTYKVFDQASTHLCVRIFTYLMVTALPPPRQYFRCEVLIIVAVSTSRYYLSVPIRHSPLQFHPLPFTYCTSLLSPACDYCSFVL